MNNTAYEKTSTEIRMTTQLIDNLVSSIKKHTLHCDQRRVDKICNRIINNHGSYGSLVHALDRVINEVTKCDMDIATIERKLEIENSIVTTYLDVAKRAKQIIRDEWKNVADIISAMIMELDFEGYVDKVVAEKEDAK